MRPRNRRARAPRGSRAGTSGSRRWLAARGRISFSQISISRSRSAFCSSVRNQSGSNSSRLSPVFGSSATVAIRCRPPPSCLSFFVHLGVPPRAIARFRAGASLAGSGGSAGRWIDVLELQQLERRSRSSASRRCARRSASGRRSAAAAGAACSGARTAPVPSPRCCRAGAGTPRACASSCAWRARS